MEGRGGKEILATYIVQLGGGEVNIIGQITVTLSHGDKECETTILVQKGASLSLLLGTDVLPSLGFYVVDGAGPGPMQELLQGKMWDHIDNSPKSKLRVEAPSFTPVQGKPAGNMPGDQQGTEASPVENPTVKLLRALRLPARHTKVIDFSTELNLRDSGGPVMFEPAQQELKEYDLQLEPSIVEPLENGVEGACTVRLVIENYNAHPVFLPANQLIGHLQPTKCLSQD